MPICEFQHPFKTVRFGYDATDKIVTLRSYEEVNTDNNVNTAEATTIVVANSNIVHHAYPVVNDNQERREFELLQFISELAPETDRIVAIPSHRDQDNTYWSTLIGIANAPLQAVTELECVLAVASLDQPATYLGCSETMIWLSGVRQTVQHLEASHRTNGLTVYDDIIRLIGEVNDNSGSEFEGRRLVLYGDRITPELLTMLRQNLVQHFDVVERFQPFRLVKSNLSAEIGKRILSRSHILGCLVGAMYLEQGLVDSPAERLRLS